MWGLLYSTKAFVKMLTPRKLDETETEPFSSFTTKEYKLHYLETLTGLRFALTSDPSVGKITDQLRTFYKLYVDYVLKNPLYTLGTVIDTPLFVQKLSTMVEALPYFE